MQTENNSMAEAPQPLVRPMRAPEGFVKWLPGDFKFRVLLEREHEQWFATAEDFTITGVGASIEAAAMQVIELVEVYLIAYFEEGKPYEAARRPAAISAGTKVEAKIGNVLASVLRGAADRIPLPREKRMGLALDPACS